MNAIIGGALIGLAATILLLFNGKVSGISGIVGGILNPSIPDKLWRIFFIIGLVTGGFLTKIFLTNPFVVDSKATQIDYIIAGLFVGFGTLLGNGCTSGHGVCGISRLSIRSIVATVTFILAGILSVLVFKYLRGGV